MDTEGRIRLIDDDELPRKNEVPLGKLPNPNCPDCFGRGFQRLLIENITETRPCHCTKLVIREETLVDKMRDMYKPKMKGVR